MKNRRILNRKINSVLPDPLEEKKGENLIDLDTSIDKILAEVNSEVQKPSKSENDIGDDFVGGKKKNQRKNSKILKDKKTKGGRKSKLKK